MYVDISIYNYCSQKIQSDDRFNFRKVKLIAYTVHNYVLQDLVTYVHSNALHSSFKNSIFLVTALYAHNPLFDRNQVTNEGSIANG